MDITISYLNMCWNRIKLAIHAVFVLSITIIIDLEIFNSDIISCTLQIDAMTWTLRSLHLDLIINFS